jgi:DNA polymerase III delta prime subunit
MEEAMKEEKRLQIFTALGTNPTSCDAGKSLTSTMLNSRPWMVKGVLDWLKNPNSGRFCCITGSPGSGKTVAASIVAHHLEQEGDCFVCSYFGELGRQQNLQDLTCDCLQQLHKYFNLFDGDDSRAALKLINALIQRAVLDPRVHNPKDTSIQYFEKLVIDPLCDFQPPEQFAFGGYVVFLFDGLNEMGQNSDLAIFDLFKNLSVRSKMLPPWVKFIFTANCDSVTETELEKLTIFLSGKMQSADMIAFATQELTRLLVPPAAVDDIIDQLKTRAFENFGYLTSALELVARCGVQLDMFPDELYGFYKLNFDLAAWLQQDKRFQRDVNNIMSLLLVSRKPLPLEFVQTTLRIYDGHKFKDLCAFISKWFPIESTRSGERRFSVPAKNLREWFVSDKAPAELRRAINLCHNIMVDCIMSFLEEWKEWKDTDPEHLLSSCEYCVEYLLLHAYQATEDKVRNRAISAYFCPHFLAAIIALKKLPRLLRDLQSLLDFIRDDESFVVERSSLHHLVEFIKVSQPAFQSADQFNVPSILMTQVSLRLSELGPVMNTHLLMRNFWRETWDFAKSTVCLVSKGRTCVEPGRLISTQLRGGWAVKMHKLMRMVP